MKMKLLLCILSVIPLFCSAQTGSEDSYFKKKYVNIGFINGSLEQEECSELKSNYGAMFSVGRTFYLHKKTIGKMLKFGIDATWFDLAYINYDVQHITHWETNNYQIHEAEAGMQIGPSLTLNPIKKMNLHFYFRYAPSFSCYYADDSFQGKYATYFVSGGTLSYSFFGLGVEWRHSANKFDPLLNLDSTLEDVKNLKTKTNGIRTYITFKF